MRIPQEREYLWLFVLFFLWGSVRANALTGKSDLNTPIRVLLHRSIPAARVKSLLGNLFVRGETNNRWLKLEQSAEITAVLPAPLRNASARTLVDALPFNERAIYIRGGPLASDKILFEGQTYRGALKFIRGRKGFLVVNHLSFQDYLLGTLGAEMSASWPLEALKAQAVASRTYARYRMAHPKNSEFDLESTVQDQVYEGVNAENARIHEAVLSTKDRVLTLEHRPIQAFFHSRCGGATESAEKVWNIRGGPALKKVRCYYCEKFPYVWKALVSAKQLLTAIRLPFLNPLQIEPGARTPSGRLASVKIASAGQALEVPAESIRSHLGYSKVKSTRFDVKIAGDEITIEGTGNGHGVGMCQWGARYLANQGRTYEEILSYYYPSSHIE